MFERELDLLSQVSGSAQFNIICMGGASYYIVQKAIKDGWLNGGGKLLHKIYHYSQPYRNVEKEIKNKIRDDLLEVVQKL